jgi:hypothetical protein
MPYPQKTTEYEAAKSQNNTPMADHDSRNRHRQSTKILRSIHTNSAIGREVAPLALAGLRGQ